jgi:hypothetical protein
MEDVLELRPEELRRRSERVSILAQLSRVVVDVTLLFMRACERAVLEEVPYQTCDFHLKGRTMSETAPRGRRESDLAWVWTRDAVYERVVRSPDASKRFCTHGGQHDS